MQEFAGLEAAAGDGGDQHDFVAVLEGVGFAAEEADVFVVDVDVDELAQLAVFVLDLGAERGEGLVDVGEQTGRLEAAESNCLRPSVWRVKAVGSVTLMDIIIWLLRQSSSRFGDAVEFA